MEETQEEVTQNYHSVLKKLADQFDPVIQLMQTAQSREIAESSWILVLFLLPFKDIARLTKIFKGLKHLNLSALPIVGLISVPITTAFLSHVHVPVLILIGVGAFVVLYAITLPSYLNQMISFGNKNFHLKAYIRFRSQEYALFEHSFLRSDFLFQGLYDYVNGVLTYKQNDSEVLKHITDQYNQEKSALREDIIELKNELKNAIDDYNDYIEMIETDLAETEDIIQYLIELLGDINVVLYRMNNKRLDYKDLTRLLSGITIYKQVGQRLELVADEGTTGASWDVIHLDDADFRHWAVVIAAKTSATKPVSNEPRPGYHVISYRMKMGVTHSEFWYLNLHINKPLNQKAWNLALNDGIIENNEVYRLLHALCLLIYNQGLKGAVQGETNTGQ